jgi:hypothetical protein
MPSITFTDDEFRQLRLVVGLHVADVYDDPYDFSAADLGLLAGLCARLGFDMWDPTSVDDACGRAPTEHEVARLARHARGLW